MDWLVDCVVYVLLAGVWSRLWLLCIWVAIELEELRCSRCMGVGVARP